MIQQIKNKIKQAIEVKKIIAELYLKKHRLEEHNEFKMIFLTFLAACSTTILGVFSGLGLDMSFILGIFSVIFTTVSCSIFDHHTNILINNEINLANKQLLDIQLEFSQIIKTPDAQKQTISFLYSMHEKMVEPNKDDLMTQFQVSLVKQDYSLAFEHLLLLTQSIIEVEDKKNQEQLLITQLHQELGLKNLRVDKQHNVSHYDQQNIENHYKEKIMNSL